jgi:deoxyinosine 3'endonuclease (endonuclease V)
MAISGKPPKLVQADVKQQPDEDEVRKLILKGGSVAEGSRASDAATAIKPMLVQLRLYPDMVQEIDLVRKNTRGRRLPAPSRHAWIVRAIEEKLARDKGL